MRSLLPRHFVALEKLLASAVEVLMMKDEAVWQPLLQIIVDSVE
jgi:hypothetical protein